MILRHPGVADVTAVGVADAVVNGNGQLIKAVVVLKPGYHDVTSDQLLTYANRNSTPLFYFTRQKPFVTLVEHFLTRDATQNADMPQYVGCLSVTRL